MGVRLEQMLDEPPPARAEDNPPSQAATMDLSNTTDISRIEKFSTPSSTSPAHGVGGAAAPVPTAALPP